MQSGRQSSSTARSGNLLMENAGESPASPTRDTVDVFSRPVMRRTWMTASVSFFACGHLICGSRLRRTFAASLHQSVPNRARKNADDRRVREWVQIDWADRALPQTRTRADLARGSSALPHRLGSAVRTQTPRNFSGAASSTAAWPTSPDTPETSRPGHPRALTRSTPSGVAEDFFRHSALPFRV